MPPDWIDVRTGRVSGGGSREVMVPRPESLSPELGRRAQEGIRLEEAPRSILTRAHDVAPDVDRIAQSILQVETGGRHDARGQSGETGGYQFMPAVWADWSSRLSEDRRPLPQTPENEHFVAKTKIKGWLDKGFSPEEIASIWNSGKPRWEGNVGVNKHGVRFDTPAYVDKFRKAYYGR